MNCESFTALGFYKKLQEKHVDASSVVGVFFQQQGAPSEGTHVRFCRILRLDVQQQGTARLRASLQKPLRLSQHYQTRLSSSATPSIFDALDTFPRRHIGPEEPEIVKMCSTVGVTHLQDLVNKTVPLDIHVKNPTRLGPGISETEVLDRIREIGKMNKTFKSYLGMGYANTLTPAVILRNLMENPGWYTQYTPYQPEIAQGRLESLINYQTMVTDLTGLPVANASLLDEGTAAAEVMLMSFAAHNRKRLVYFIDSQVFPQTIACVKTRAECFGIQVVVGDYATFKFDKYKDQLMGVLVQVFCHLHICI